MVAVIQNVEEIQTVIMNCSSNEEAKRKIAQGKYTSASRNRVIQQGELHRGEARLFFVVSS